MWWLAPVVLVALGCNRDVEHDASTPPPAPPSSAPTERAAEGQPHSAIIREVAASEQGDAAVSIDQIGGLRLWTALDGSREPVPISAPAPAQIAVASTAFEVTVAVLDQAGSAHVLRFGRDGVPRGRTQVPGDVAISQIVALGDHLLALRADQSIDELDASGRVRAHLAADPGERIAALAVRAGGALAVLANDDGTASTVRWLEHGNGLVWGLRMTLPAAVVPASVALSPSHRWLAAGEAKSHQMFVYDLSVQPALATSTAIELQPGEPIGFVDDHEVAALAPLRWWTVGTKGDPWEATTPQNPAPAVAMATGAAANGVVVSAVGPDLALVTDKGARYLGWAEMNPSSALLVGDTVAITTSAKHYAWLDRALVETHSADLAEATAYGQPIDDRHAVTHRAGAHGEELDLVDFEHVDRPVKIGEFASVHRIDYEPHTQTLFVDEYSRLRRYHLDLAAGVVTELSSLKLGGESLLRLLDPTATGGALAIVGTYDDTNRRLDELRERGGKLVREKLPAVPGVIASFDASGGVWWRERVDGPIHHGDVTLPAADAVVPDHAGATALLSDGTTVALYDAGGTQRWRVPAWRSYELQFTGDDRQVLVHGVGGLVMLDAATGARVAAACGWRFGIRDSVPDVTAAGADSVCEDSE